jgi:3-hydroxyisobutyrate dehydrogenase-like beta-hydroxyacid dehydrogenase
LLAVDPGSKSVAVARYVVDPMQKDVRLALQTADELQLPLPPAHAAREALTRADELGYGH